MPILTVAETDWMEQLIVPVVTTVVIGAVGIVLLMLALIALNKMVSYNLDKEIGEDHNVSAGILMGSVVIGLSIIIAAVVRG